MSLSFSSHSDIHIVVFSDSVMAAPVSYCSMDELTNSGAGAEKTTIESHSRWSSTSSAGFELDNFWVRLSLMLSTALETYALHTDSLYSTIRYAKSSPVPSQQGPLPSFSCKRACLGKSTQRQTFSYNAVFSPEPYSQRVHWQIRLILMVADCSGPILYHTRHCRHA